MANLVILFFSIFAINSFAALHPTGGYYELGTKLIPAPAADRADKLGEFNELEFYRWTYQVSPIVTNADQAQSLLEGLEEDALSTAETSREGLASDPAKKAAFETELRRLLLEELKGSTPGPYQPAIWSWYQREIAYEKTHSTQVAALESEKRPWMANHLANQKFTAENAAVIRRQAEARQASITSSRSSKNAEQAGVEWDRANAEAIRDLATRRTQFVQAEAAKLLQDAALASAQDWASAETAHQAALNELKATPFMRPEIYRRVMELKEPQRAADQAQRPSEASCRTGNCPVDDYAIYIDVETALNNMLDIEEQNSDLPKKSTVGFDGYSIIDASVESVFSAFMFRNGLPARAGELNLPNTATFPVDDLFSYRRETSQVTTAIWGANSYFNKSLKQRPLGRLGASFIEPLSDSYVVLVRGNAREGYDILFQFLGKSCFPDEGQNIAQCRTPTKSNFSILILRPVGEKKTSFRMSGRYMGQSYKIIDDTAGLVSQTGTSTIGFSREKFLKGQFEFNQVAKRMDVALSRIAGGRDVKRISSRGTGHFFEETRLQQLDPSTQPSARLFPIVEQQNFYLVDGDLVQLIEDRGSRAFDGSAMQLFPIRNIR
jgi:hypothetical protein